MRTSLLLPLLLLACAPKAPLPPGPMRVVRDARPWVPTVREHDGLRLPPDAGSPGDRELPARPERPGRRQALGDQLAAAARALLEGPYPAGFRDDCSGFVCAASDRVGMTLPPTTETLWEAAREAGTIHRRKRPRVGDLAFFDDTWDRNRNGRLDDPLTHVGVVVEVEADGTVLVAHRSTSQGRAILRMNLLRPGDRQDESGKVLNDYLRRKERRDPPRTKYLAGELWRGFAGVEGMAR